MPLSALPSHGRADSGVGNTPLAGASASIWETWPSPSDVQVPVDADFSDQGEVIPVGSAGEWDDRIDGAFNVVGAVKNNDDGLIYLFYVGASGDRSSDGGPKDREIGVATSSDGLSFTKSASNPLISYQPNGAEEEGIFSGGMWTDGETIYLMAGAMESTGADTVDGSGDLYTSTDGIDWTADTRDVLDPTGSGQGDDERFPFAAYESGGTRHVYYSAKGTDVDHVWDATHVSGSTWAGLDTYSDLGFAWKARAGGQVIKKAASTYLLSITDATNEVIRVYTFDPAIPTTLTEQTQWAFSTFGMTATQTGNQDNGLLYLDRDLGKWFHYYITGSGPDGTGIQCHTATMTLV